MEGTGSTYSNSSASLIRDTEDKLSEFLSLQDTDIILLITPFTLPIDQETSSTSDPFEPLGRALATRHPRVRHVPYLQQNGITSTHVGLLHLSNIVVFVVTGAPKIGDHQEIDFAHVSRTVLGDKPMVLVVTCDLNAMGGYDRTFSTVVQSRGSSSQELEAVAAVIFGELVSPKAPSRQQWSIEAYNEPRDLADVHELWHKTLPEKFKINRNTLMSLLDRPGYARHHVVRSPENRLLGFCATYLTYADQAGERLIASIAVVLVQQISRERGIGLSLLNYAIKQFEKTRGIARIRIGSTFPRLLHGIPHESLYAQQWFGRRGWSFDKLEDGHGQSVYDLIVDLKNWQIPVLSSRHPIVYRAATEADMPQVLNMVNEESTREDHMGWFDQYARVLHDVHRKDIIVGVDKDTIVATALTYTPSCGSPIAADLPWPSQIGEDVGGVTCISITR
jgi:GNAT superfamily N-acetyltransferase